MTDLAAFTAPGGLWATDGTPNNAELLASVTLPQNLTASNGLVYFTAGTPATGRELWATDGAPVGTSMLKDIFRGEWPSSPHDLTPFDGGILFSAWVFRLTTSCNRMPHCL